jgi:hypothetical protein
VIVSVDVVLVVDRDGGVVRPFSPGSRHFVAVGINDQDHAHDNISEPKNGHLGQSY